MVTFVIPYDFIILVYIHVCRGARATGKAQFRSIFISRNGWQVSDFLDFLSFFCQLRSCYFNDRCTIKFSFHYTAQKYGNSNEFMQSNQYSVFIYFAVNSAQMSTIERWTRKLARVYILESSPHCCFPLSPLSASAPAVPQNWVIKPNVADKYKILS